MGVRTWVVGLGLALGLVATVGCGQGGPAKEPTVLVKGTVTNAGQPLPVAPNLADKKEARAMIRFIREGGGAAGQPSVSAPAFTEADGSFEVRIPKGKYRISLDQAYAPPASRALLSKFDVRSSPITQEVTAEGQEINLDLSKFDVSKIPDRSGNR